MSMSSSTIGHIENPARFRLIGIAVGLAAVLGIASRPVLVKLAYADSPDPITLLAIQMGFSLPFFACLSVYAIRQEERRRPGIAETVLACLLGLVCYHLSNALDFAALQYISVGVARLLGAIYPTLVVLLSALFLSKPIRLRHVAALIVSYAGVALVLSTALGAAGGNHLLGAAYMIVAAIMLAVYLTAGSRLVVRMGSLQFTCYAMMAACVAAILQFAVMRPLPALLLPPRIYMLAAAMALLSTSLPMLLTGEALRRIGANHFAMIGALGPVFTIAMGYVALGETMTGIQLAGAACVLSGVILIVRSDG